QFPRIAGARPARRSRSVRARRAHYLVWQRLRVDRLERGRAAPARARVKSDVAAAADARAERAQAVRGGRAIPAEAALVAACRRLRLVVLAQDAANVPSRCSSAFALRCSAGSEPPVV